METETLTLRDKLDELGAALAEFRDAVLHQRGAIAENGMTNDQVNDVLREFDLFLGSLTPTKD